MMAAGPRAMITIIHIDFRTDFVEQLRTTRGGAAVDGQAHTERPPKAARNHSTKPRACLFFTLDNTQH